MSYTWKHCTFGELTPGELYDIMQLRSEVFVVEQNCPYQDADGKDPKSIHLMARNAEGTLVAYCRLLPSNVSYDEPSIGRVVTSQLVRRNGAGRELMSRAISLCERLFGHTPIRIGAQQYLQRFYESFGFVVEGEPYMEDGIPHIHMVRE